MFLAVDIGNTKISFAMMKGSRAVSKISLDQSQKRATAKEVLAVMASFKNKYASCKDVLICSVVPSAIRLVIIASQKQFGISPIVVGKDIKVPIDNKYRKPKEVGQDRLVCAYAAKCLYGCPAIVIDLGTAITFDVVSESGAYEGGIIIPGIRLSAESLSQKTALLPLIERIKSLKKIIGKSTEESILSGLFNGYGAMCSGLIDRLSSELSRKPKIIVTGGHTQLMKKYIKTKITAIDSLLVFKGMHLLYEKIYKD